MRAAGVGRASSLAVLLLLALPGEAGADRYRGIRAMIRSEIDGAQVPSLAVAVAHRGEIVWEEAFGWADPARQIAATPHTMYSLASVSKPLTSTGLMVLVERGEVDLDRPINNYLGEARLQARVGDPQGATVRQVADHTSGLPLHHHFLLDEHPRPRPSLEQTIGRYGNLITEPGERFQYSNLGYAVLEYMIERVSGEAFGDFMQEEVFVPLGLEHTSVLRSPRGAEGVAVRLDASGALPFYYSDHGGGSAIFSCAHDLVRFGLFHLRVRLPDQARILSASTLARMQRSSSRRTDGGGYYGIGWAIRPGPIGTRVVRHDGGMPGASASLTLLPAQKVAVAVLSNTQSTLPQRVTSAILAQVAPQLASRSPTWDEDTAGSTRRRSRRPGRFMGTWAGAVELVDRNLPIALIVERRGDLRARLGSGPEKRVWGAAFQDGGLTGWTTGLVGNETVADRPQVLRLDLKLRGDRLSGAVTAFSRSPDGLPRALSYWAALERGRGLIASR